MLKAFDEVSKVSDNLRVIEKELKFLSVAKVI